MQNPGIYRTEVYSETWDTQNARQIQKPVKHLRRSNDLVSNFRGKVNIFNNFLVQQFQATANNGILPTNQILYIQNRLIDIDCRKILKLMV